MNTGISIIANIVNIILLIGGIAAFVLLIIVLVKANKALNIWLKQNKD